MKPVVGVLGAGSWGTALAKLLSDNHRSVLIWARSGEVCRELNEARSNERYLPGVRLGRSVVATTDEREVCEQCSLLFLALPSHVVREVVLRIERYLQGDHIVVHGTKGLECETRKRMSEILREETCLRKIGVISGPNLAAEVAEQCPSGALLASKYDEVISVGQAALHSRYYRVFSGNDVIGAEIGGALSSVIAMAAGAVHGLGFGANTKSLLLSRSLIEMALLGGAMGAQPSTFWGLSGIGDLMAMSSSPLSRSFQVGERLAQGESIEAIVGATFKVAEGVRTAQAIHSYAEDRGLDLPIVGAMYSVLHERLPLAEAIDRLLTRPAGIEIPAGVLASSGLGSA